MTELSIAVRAALKIMGPSQTVALNSSSISEEIARSLSKFQCHTLITDSVHVASAMAGHPHHEILLLGDGRAPGDRWSKGAISLLAARSIFIDVLVLSELQIDYLGGVTTNNSEEARVLRGLAARSSKIVAIAASNLLGSSVAFSAVNSLDIDVLLVLGKVNDQTQLFEDNGIDVYYL